LAEATGVEVWMARGDADDLRSFEPAPYEPEHLVSGGDLVEVAGISFRSFDVPGHTPGSVAFAANGIAFVGDVLFAGSIGRTDFVQKEMYSFHDRSDRPLTLRPESTAPVMRAYLDGMTRMPQPVKLWYCQSHYRYNAVQRGRAREHYQFGVEVIGSEDAAVDAEVIALQARWYQLCGVPELRLALNSVGDAVCRPGYVKLLVAFIDQHADQLCEECLVRRKTNPLRVLDCKNRECQAVLAAAPRITDHLCEDCARHFAEVQRYLDARGVAYQLTPSLVRGLDYYTRTAWEWNGAGLATSISGGGRYDGLAEQIGGPAI